MTLKNKVNKYKAAAGCAVGNIIADMDRLLLYTDGVTEAINAHNELYGEERLSGFFGVDMRYIICYNYFTDNVIFDFKGLKKCIVMSMAKKTKR